MLKVNKKRKDIIIGCSNMGAYIASRLSEMGDDVIVIDRNAKSFRTLEECYSGFTVEGDALDNDFLAQNEVAKADLVLIATEDDDTNSYISQYVKCILGVKIVITRIYDTDKTIVLADTGIKIIYPSILVSQEFFSLLDQAYTEQEN